MSSHRKHTRRRHERQVSSQAASESLVEPNAADDQNPIVQLSNPKKTLGHFYLQNLMARRILSFDLAEKMYQVCARMCGVRQPEDLLDFLAGLNLNLALCGLDIKVFNEQESGLTFVTLVNSHSDPIAKLATDYNPLEIVYFRILIKKIMLAPKLAFCVSWTDAVRCVRDEALKTKMSAVEAEKLLKSLIAKGWLDIQSSRHSATRLTLSSRAIMELATYLTDTFGSDEDDTILYLCRRCTQIVTHGLACPREGCGVTLHKHCLVALDAGKCPGEPGSASACRELWTADGKKYFANAIGVDALKTDKDENVVPRARRSTGTEAQWENGSLNPPSGQAGAVEVE